MTLEELALLNLPQPTPRVPAWTFGFWRRRSITFANGTTDEGTRVFWLQSGGLTADLRLPARRFDTTGRDARLRFEGGLARTAWDGQKMSWSGWTSFQLHDKWPEPAILTRVGDCLIEFAPSGIYVEDWRLQPSAPGLLTGLELIEELDAATGAVRHRGGGLIVTCAHAAFIKGRPEPLEGAAHLKDYLSTHAQDESALDRVFAFEASVAERNETGVHVVTASSRPEREGKALFAPEGFSFDPATGIVTQRANENGIDLERRFIVDTLIPSHAFDSATAAQNAALDWLAEERDTLQRDARPLPPAAP